MANSALPFQHVLQTRFNMPTPGREASFRNRPGWLNERFELFEAYCLPSVGAQTVEAGRDFTWIIYFDRDTPDAFRARIERLREVVPFIPFYTGIFPSSGWPQSLRQTLPALAPYVLTSRLDNDDALAFDYMERTAVAAQDALRRGLVPDGVNCARVGIVITKGFIRSPTRAYAISHPCNAFASWLEASADDAALKTALGISHMAAEAEGPLVQVPGPGGWLQIIHGGNVSNKVRGERISTSDLESRFLPGALAGLQRVGKPALMAENLVVGPIRSLRDAVSATLQRLKRKG